MTIDVTPAEADLLRRLLEEKLRDLQHEIHRTDHRAFRAGLKADRDLLEALVARLGAFSSPTT